MHAHRLILRFPLLIILFAPGALLGQLGTPYDVSGVWQARQVDPAGKLPEIVTTLTFTPTGARPKFLGDRITLFYHTSVEVNGVLSYFGGEEVQRSSGYGRLEMFYPDKPIEVSTYFNPGKEPTFSFLAYYYWATGDIKDNRIWIRGNVGTSQYEGPLYPFRDNAFEGYFDSTGPSLSAYIDDLTILGIYTKWARKRFDRIASGGGAQSAVGQIEGTITTQATTLTERDNAVHSATISVYLQEQGRVRAKRGNESEADYQAYVEGLGLKLIATTEMKKTDEGNFIFDEIPAQRILAFTKNRLAYFTIVVEAAETDEFATDGNGQVIPGQTTTLLFAPARIHNITVGTPKEDVTLSLEPFDAIGVKEELMRRLAELSTVNYKVELASAQSWVQQIKGGGIAITPEVDEALWRSIWADRATVGAYVFADQLATLSTSALAALMGDLISDFFPLKNEKLDGAKKRVEAFNKDQTKFFKGKDPSRKAIMRIVDDTALVRKSANYGHAAVAIGLLNPRIEAALIKAGLPQDKVKKVMTIWSDIIGVIMAALKEQSVAGAGKAIFSKIVQETVKASKPLLVDSVDGVSYAGQTRNHIKYATDTAMAWNTANREQWLIDRGKAVEAITAMNDTLTGVVTRSEVLSTVAGGFGNAETGMQYLGLILPQAKYAEKFSKVSKYVSNSAAFVEPLVRMYTTLPDSLTTATTAAFGQFSSAFPYSNEPPAARFFAPMALSTFDTQHLLYPDTAPYLAALAQVQTNLQADDMGALGEDCFGEAANSFYNEVQRLGDELAAYMLQAAGFIPDTLAQSGSKEPKLYIELAALQSLMGTLQAREAALGAALSELLSNVFTEFYTGPQDPEYLIQKAIVLQKTNEVDFLFELLDARIYEIDRQIRATITYGNVEPIPGIAVERVSLESSTTGEEFVSTSGDSFDLVVRVRHLGGAYIPDLQADLTVYSAHNAYAVVNAQTQPVDLNPGESALLSWKINYTGSLRNDNAIFSVALSSTADNDQTFNSNTLDVPLLVDPDLWDQDGDGMEDAWEAEKGLNPQADDRFGDFDKDGADNWTELRYGLKVNDPDSDGDGLLDGEEIMPGADGFLTNALSEDTDGDGLLDAVDPSPADGADVDYETAPPEPQVALGHSTTFLSPDAPVALVDVYNAAQGELVWAGTSFDPDIVQVSPDDEPFSGDGFLIVSMASGAPVDLLDSVVTQVSIRDRIGGIPDEQLLNVVITHDERQRLFQDLPSGGMWRLSNWFGQYDRTSSAPWWFHQEHGWLQTHESDQSIGDAYIYDAGLQSWIMTTDRAYPFVYVFRQIPGITPGWVRYVPGGTPAVASFSPSTRS